MPSQTAAHQAPPSMDFPGKSIGVGCHCLLREKPLLNGKSRTLTNIKNILMCYFCDICILNALWYSAWTIKHSVIPNSGTIWILTTVKYVFRHRKCPAVCQLLHGLFIYILYKKAVDHFLFQDRSCTTSPQQITHPRPLLAMFYLTSEWIHHFCLLSLFVMFCFGDVKGR